MIAYTILNVIGIVSLLIYHLVHIREHQALPHWRLRSWAAKRRRSGRRDVFSRDRFWVVVGIVIIATFQYAPASFLNQTFGNLLQTGANYYGLMFFTPFFLFIGCWIMRIDPCKQVDIVTPAFPIALIFAKVGCFFAGCCSGIPWEYGLRNPHSQVKEFPIQLLEAAVAFLIFLILRKIRNRLKSGTVFPVYLILYSALRFATEFLRSEDNIWLCFKLYHFLCFAGIVIGIIEYCLVATFGSRISQKLNLSASKVPKVSKSNKN